MELLLLTRRVGMYSKAIIQFDRSGDVAFTMEPSEDGSKLSIKRVRLNPLSSERYDIPLDSRTTSNYKDVIFTPTQKGR